MVIVKVIFGEKAEIFVIVGFLRVSVNVMYPDTDGINNRTKGVTVEELGDLRKIITTYRTQRDAFQRRTLVNKLAFWTQRRETSEPTTPYTKAKGRKHVVSPEDSRELR
ncbi:hypothetical protein K501DRAFT_265661 [Backusella circina FSU 941]|nr:hypothetical protein K501DRAFT_265661 [Backusella circina FSU 941]